MNFKHKALTVVKRKLPTFLTVGSCIGVVATAYFTGKAVLEADRYLNTLEPEEIKQPKTRLHLAKIYALPVGSGLVTIAFNIANHITNNKIHNAYIAAYGILNTAYQTMQMKLPVEQLAQIEQEMDHEKIEQELPKLLKNRPGDDYILWTDDIRKHPFWAREVDILKGKDELNVQLLNPNFSRSFGLAGLETFYSHVIGDPEPQDYLWGWDIDYMNYEWDCGFLEIDWRENDPYIDEDGNAYPCNHICWWCEPMKEYWNYDWEKR